mmetsp:Transcript_16475/g.28242  ORF Transcript_16475/g.28242 Transcript_16475/m.28242 type:complete len:110 (-) Transcript_16475:178-507(-)|eukprot:CAMPEP_0119105252 /NCGR_PEP_ID=MMETSP1180-20130426/3271_1 /TAXON_ID=3052 ORGANISM="Chlamydomonas cf sp, Strain CCMP681" /NCGR_SAMPLE_ID=MMETSP1180 /ASSEMBLY_ACC=CAM_ASM_000741 /LENGTH=109 /DNA_ID=CAMNT_0007090261 /DNA_START=96 /DNA_END=425 /DNA_ORIENTATION=+
MLGGGKGPGVPTPKYAKAVKVVNNGASAINVTVSYDDHKNNAEIHEKADLAPGASFEFPEKSLDMGSWQAAAPVKHISCGSVNLVPSVGQVVPQLLVHVDGAGKLSQQP